MSGSGSGSGSCSYFILQKSKNKNVDDETQNKITMLDLNKKVYILPQNNINYYSQNGLFEKGLIEWSKQFCSPDKNMLDIGAHSGTYAISLAHLCDKVYAFEPQQMTYYSLCGSVALSNIKNINCLKYGLGSTDQVGLQTLNIISDDGGGSTLHVASNDNGSGSKSTVLKTETIEVKTLDRFNITNISFIKMDVEDNELNVLQGSLITLKCSNYPTILFESNTFNEKLFDFLKALKYSIINVKGFSNMYLASID